MSNDRKVIPMAQRKLRLLCLVVVLAILAGMFTGCQDATGTTTGAYHSTNNSISTSQATVPVTFAPVTTVPTEPEPTELPTTVPLPTEPPATAPTEPEVEVTPVVLPELHAKNAFVYDTRSEAFLYATCDTAAALYPASITKLFTTYVALKYLDMDTEITVGSELKLVASDASVVGFKKGDVVSVEALVYGALLPSGCDASYILATAAGRVILDNRKASASDAIAAFIKECNRQALLLQMPGTYFANPDGYHKSGHHISMEGMAIIGSLVLENESIAAIVVTPSATVTYRNAEGKTREVTFQNTNKTIHSGSKTYYHPLSVGLKTGTTDAAGACLLAAYRVDGGYILVGVFGGTQNNARFADANALFEAYYPYL